MILLCPIHNGLWLTDSTLWASSQLTTSSIHWPCYGNFHLCIVIFFDSVCFFSYLFQWKRICAVFFIVLPLEIQISREKRIPLTSLTTPRVCPNPGSGLSSSNVVVGLVFNDLKVICDCRWYWWNCWPPLVLIKLYFHQNTRAPVLTWVCTSTVKPVCKGHSREPENETFISNCPLYTGSNYMHYSLMGEMRLIFIDIYLLCRSAL